MKKFTYFDRDLSWLSFNHRVLLEAKNINNSIIERIKFLAIFSSNLDEFYSVRYPFLKAVQKIETKAGSYQSKFDISETADKIIDKQLKEFGQTIKSVVSSLKKEKIIWVYNTPIPETIQQEVNSYFLNSILGHIQVIDLGKKNVEFFPENNKIYLAVTLKKKKERKIIVPLPSFQIQRLILFEKKGKKYIVFLDDIIKSNLKWVFPNIEITSALGFKVTRNAEINYREDVKGDFLTILEEKLKKRDYGLATRLLYDPDTPVEFLDQIRSQLNLKTASLVGGGTYHHLKDLFDFPRIKDLDNKFIQWQSAAYPLSLEKSIFEQIDEKDILFHTPYHLFDPVVRFFNEAATHPMVKEIKLTIYRVANDSRILKALISAAKNGKSVTVFVELKARFDEENNLNWAKIMKKAGIKIIYSDPTLKVHAKVALVKIKSGKSEILYGLFGTGNLNENTAKIYTDHFLLTSDFNLTTELKQALMYLEKIKNPEKKDPLVFKSLLVAQFNLLDTFLSLIQNETNFAKQGKSGEIFIKLNNLEEQSLIDALYSASNSGVKIRLLVRGICRLIPGIRGQSENITVRRIVDRYLEHGRIFVFHNEGDPIIFMGSADWMNRNIHHRIEICFPILKEILKKQILHIMELQWSDNMKAVELKKPLRNVPLINQGDQIRSQKAILDYFAKSHNK